eukprot:UN12123
MFIVFFSFFFSYKSIFLWIYGAVNVLIVSFFFLSLVDSFHSFIFSFFFVVYIIIASMILKKNKLCKIVIDAF